MQRLLGTMPELLHPLTITTPFTVLIDGREKAPYTFTELNADANKGNRPLSVATRWAYLPTGDYTIAGMESLIAIERKSLVDLYSTLGQHRERFEREHERMASMTFAAVVIESDWSTILNCPPERSRLLPKVIFRTAISWMQRFGVPWLTFTDRRLAEIATFRILEKFWEKNGEE
jgi:ERCC4-type nuclease